MMNVRCPLIAIRNIGYCISIRKGQIQINPVGNIKINRTAGANTKGRAKISGIIGLVVIKRLNYLMFFPTYFLITAWVDI